MRPALILATGLLLAVTAPVFARPVAGAALERFTLARPVNVELTPGNAAADIESQRIALEAARLEAELRRNVLKRQRDQGSISDGQYRDGLRQYSVAIDGYRRLRPGRAGAPDAAQAEAWERQLVDFSTARDGPAAAPSVLADVDVLRGDRGEVRLDSAGLQRALDERLAQAQAALPEDPRYAPARGYLEQLSRQTDAELARLAAADGSVALAEALPALEEVQVVHAMMAMDAWPISLQLRSVPEQAFVELRAVSSPALQFTTDTTREIIRGWFDYTVRKEGYKTIEGRDLNLVFARGLMSCRLVPVDSAQEPLPCNIE